MNNTIKAGIITIVMAGLVGCGDSRVVTLCETDQKLQKEYFEICMEEHKAAEYCRLQAIALGNTCKDFLVQDKDEADGMKKAIDLIKEGIEE